MGTPSQNSVIFEKYFFGQKKYWKITKTGWCYRGMAVVVYIVLNKEFLAHIKWVTCKSHIVRRVSGGIHIKPSPTNGTIHVGIIVVWKKKHLQILNECTHGNPKLSLVDGELQNPVTPEP
jgi:hypothetical protein